MTIAYPWGDEAQYHTPEALLGEYIITSPDGGVVFVPENAITLRVSNLTDNQRKQATNLINLTPQQRIDWAIEVHGMARIREGH